MAPQVLVLKITVKRAKVGIAKKSKIKVGKVNMGRAKPGLRVKGALSKAMKLRKLALDTCAVTLVNDPDKVS